MSKMQWQIESLTAQKMKFSVKVVIIETISFYNFFLSYFFFL